MSGIRPIRLLALAAVLATPAAYASDTNGDAVNGKALFENSGCPACHGVTKEDNAKVGPNLVGVVGRKAGTTQSLLGPSENMKKYGVIWSAETLDEFLLNPSAKVPGTAMAGILREHQGWLARISTGVGL